VDLYDGDNDTEVTYQIVGELEADLSLGQISIGSPIAQGLIGREAGEEVKVQTPGGLRVYEVLKIRYV